jgi:Mn-dependent DtxR family transcriptional regulator
MGMRGQGAGVLERIARRLRRAGLLEAAVEGWRLTPAGLAAATEQVRKHRLWELYLTRFLDLPSDHVHRDAEAMEHSLDAAAVDRLETLLGHPTVDPHGEPIPARRTA